eukprot:GHVQ01006256.1.p1 GENE.GHVQ01006256.1~~GHVQ01006256.1.p1  ORF type:complete len:139 (+),score=20.77 GHVQ01006256.1:363-779(+)
MTLPGWQFQEGRPSDTLRRFRVRQEPICAMLRDNISHAQQMNLQTAWQFAYGMTNYARGAAQSSAARKLASNVPPSLIHQMGSRLCTKEPTAVPGLSDTTLADDETLAVPIDLHGHIITDIWTDRPPHGVLTDLHMEY